MLLPIGVSVEALRHFKSSFVRLAGSKCSQYLRIQPSGEYIGFPYAAGEERKGKGKWNLP
jgi:hypothetical protein